MLPDETTIVLSFTIEGRNFEIILRGDEADNASEIAERIRDSHNLTVVMKALAVV